MGEPIVHFFILGALIFAIDFLLNGSRDEFRSISVSKSDQAKIAALYRTGRGRNPTKEEMTEQIERWIDGEVLYREGLSLGLDRGDPSIKERVIANTVGMIKASTSMNKDSDSDVKQWLNSRRGNYNISIESSPQ